MASPILSIKPWKLVEKQGKRQPYVQYKDEKFVKGLFEVAKKVIDAPATPAKQKRQYIDAIENINAHYFAAQELNETTQGQFYRYDATAEDQLRATVASGVSQAVGDLRALCTAHTAVIQTATTQLASQYDDAAAVQDAAQTFEQTIATCTIRTVRDGWFPMFESYYFSLNPGERAAEGRERREQRLSGTETTQGVAERLANTQLEQITHEDLGRLQQIDANSTVNGHPIIHKLQTKYEWAICS